MPSSDFVDFIYRASRIRLGQSAKALVWRWRQICPLKIDIFTLSAPNSTKEVSMFKLAIEVCIENHFGLIHAIFLSLGSTKSGYFFLGHPVYIKLKTYNTYYLITLPTKYYTLLLKQYHLERKITSTKWQHKTKNTNIALHVTTLKDKDST